MVEGNLFSLRKICKFVYIVMDTAFLFTELQQNEIELKFREAENKESARWVEARKITGRLNPKISAAQSDSFRKLD